MKRGVFGFGLLVVASTLLLARNAADLKADLKSMMPAGVTKIRLAWANGGPWQEFPFNATGTSVYVVDSDDGVIRQLSTRGKMVNLTADGSRVFYQINSNEIGIRNFDGSGTEKTANVGGRCQEYWLDPADNSDWVVSSLGDEEMWRVKLDSPTTRVQLSKSSVQKVLWNGGTGLSDDGKRLVGYTPDQAAAFYITNTSDFSWIPGTHGGCWGSMSAGSHPYYNHNPSGHTALCVHDALDQSKFTNYATGAAIEAFTKSKNLQQTWSGGEFTTEGSRFAQHPEYVTTAFQQSKVNPFLIHLPDLKLIYIDDNIAANRWCGDMDAVFLPRSTVGVINKNSSSLKAGALHPGIANSDTYLPDGRRIGSSLLRAKAARGVVIQYAKDSPAFAHKTVLVD